MKKKVLGYRQEREYVVDYFSPANERRRESSLSAEPVAGRKDRKAVAVPIWHCKQASEFNYIMEQKNLLLRDEFSAPSGAQI